MREYMTFSPPNPPMAKSCDGSKRVSGASSFGGGGGGSYARCPRDVAAGAGATGVTGFADSVGYGEDGKIIAVGGGRGGGTSCAKDVEPNIEKTRPSAAAVNVFRLMINVLAT